MSSAETKQFKKSRTEKIEEVKSSRADGVMFKPGVMTNKPSLILFVGVFLAMLGVTIYGAMQGYYGKFNMEHTATIEGKDLPIPSSFVMNGHWTGMMIAGLAIAAVWPTLFLGLLSAFAHTMVWVSCLTGPAFFLAAGGLILGKSGEKTTAVWISGGCTIGVGVLLLLVTWCFRKKIAFTATLVRTSSKLTIGHPSVLVAGIWHSALGLGWIALTLCAWVPLTELIGNGYAAGGILLFPMLWGALVFQYAYLVTTAGVMARWYFGEVVSVGGALSATWMYCLGSVCLGAALMAIIQVIQILVEAATHDDNGRPNIAYFICRPILDTIEWLAQIFNRFTFALVAIYHFDFWLAGYEATKILSNSGLTAFAQDLVLGWVTLMASLTNMFVTSMLLFLYSGTSLLGYLPAGFAASGLPGLFARHGGDAQVELWAFEVLVCGLIFSVTLSGAIASALEGMTTALLVCFAEDPRQLEVKHPELHAAMSERVRLLQPKDEEKEPAV